MDPRLLAVLAFLLVLIVVAVARSEVWRMKPDRDGRLFVDRGKITHRDFATWQERHPDREFHQIDITLTCGPAAQERTLLLWRLRGSRRLSEPIRMAFWVSITLQNDADADIDAILLPRYRDGWNLASERREITTAV